MEQNCINWEFGKDSDGYGACRINGKVEKAHRVAICKHLGIPLSDILGKVVLHQCDNPSCVNPYHLQIGTQADNVKDMISKKRDNFNGRIKFTDDEIKTVKWLVEQGLPKNNIQSEYGISKSYLNKLIRGLHRE